MVQAIQQTTNLHLTRILWIIGWVVGILVVLFVLTSFVPGYIYN